jgi:hypothetical protein
MVMAIRVAVDMTAAAMVVMEEAETAAVEEAMAAAEVIEVWRIWWPVMPHCGAGGAGW